MGKNERNPISLRISTRTVERIVERYAKKLNLNFKITPETLRNSYILNLLNQEKKIKIINTPLPHKTFTVNHYEHVLLNKKFENYKESNTNKLLPPWDYIEKSINAEITWLKNNILTMPERFSKQNPSFLKCDNCILRKIAILIVSGKIEAAEFKTKRKNLWNHLARERDLKKIKEHGKEWHSKMMNIVSEYFRSKNYTISTEPPLNYGYADLRVHSKSNNFTIYVEIGTVSLFKLWYNFLTMKNVIFLVIPSENYAIEFKT